MALNRGLLVLLPALSAAALACNGSSSGEAPAATTSAAEVKSAPVPTVSASASASAAAAHKPMRRGGGLTGWLLAGANDLKDLKDDQNTKLDALEKTLHADESTHTEMKDFHAELSDEVKAGKIDNAKLEPKYVAIEAAMKARQDKEATSLATLHDILTTAQRKEITDAIRAKQKDMEEKMKAREAEHKPEEMQKRKLDRMTKELGLDDGQAKKVDALLSKDKPTQAQMDAKKDEMKKKMDALLTAFEADTFDAKKLDLAPAGKKAREPLERLVSFYSGLLPILKPDQKDKLVAKMQHPPMRPGMRPGMEAPMGSVFDDPPEAMPEH
jgi:Spy/CpxP family protein refolding chaperone